MYKLKEIAEQVYYVGVNDRQKALFEGMWPLPYGVSYNAYLIVDEKTALIDTVDVCYADIFLKKVADALQGRPLDYLIVDHMEPDHAGSIRLLRQLYPNVQIIGNSKTFGMLEGFHGIQDNGIGMSQQDVEHAFDRFYRADSVRNSKTGGTGLGLAIAKWIVEKHQGYYDIVSREGLGTRFQVIFPNSQ